MLAAFTQPLLHEFDLVALRAVDAAGHVDQLGVIGAVGHQRRHLQRLVMVRDHVVHELHIIRRKTGVGDLNGLFGAEFAPGLARRTRLDDGGVV